MTPSIIVLFPGASHMEITTTADGSLEVRCPGCGAVQQYEGVAGEARHGVFVHEDECPVHALIEAALNGNERDR